MSDIIKRVAAIHDISCFGKCSLTIALPVISSAGIETSVIPTAVLSTPTGIFNGFTYRDLTEDINSVADHWKSIGVSFDAIYTGFLGSFEQIKIVSDIITQLKDANTYVVIDPVMGDNGKLYSVYDTVFSRSMTELCKKADIIVPNITEAFFLLEEPFCEGPYTRKEIEDILIRLSDKCDCDVVLTGVMEEKTKIGAACYNKTNRRVNVFYEDKTDGFYHGTGDIFASVLTAATVSGLHLDLSTKLATQFTSDCIKRTKLNGSDWRFGVNFEQELCTLADRIKKISL